MCHKIASGVVCVCVSRLCLDRTLKVAKNVGVGINNRAG